MKLKPAIASYSGGSFRAIRGFLTEEVLELVAEIAVSPKGRAQVEDSLFYELQEMHVLTEYEGTVRLGTAVFLKDDIPVITRLACDLGEGLAAALAGAGAGLDALSPEIKNFLGGIIGVGQGLHYVLRSERTAFDWKYHEGRYAQSKVDFDEVCDGLETLGPDWQAKSVLRGDRYTAVFIGPGGEDYQTGLLPLLKEAPEFGGDLLMYLTDALAMLVAGNPGSPSLLRIAEKAGLLEDGKPRPVLVDTEVYRNFAPIVRSVSEASYEFYLKNIPRIFECLKTTAAGRQGVPPQNMMMHFWRHCRKGLANKLYESGFFTDRVPSVGRITVFYDNSIRELNSLL